MQRDLEAGKVHVMLVCSDVVAHLETVPEATYDAVLCDPPYGLKFMAKKWDVSVPGVDAWRAILRVLKPGASMLAFGGTRTVHRLTCAIEDAGFQIRDQLVYLHGMGFPKSHRADLAIDDALGEPHTVTGTRALAVDGSETVTINTVSATARAARRWAGWGTALKPAHEPIVLARRPLAGTLGANLLEHGTGALNIDGTRLGGERPLTWAVRAPSDNGCGEVWGKGLSDTTGQGSISSPLGRWPSNVILDDAAGAMLDAAVGDRSPAPKSTAACHRNPKKLASPAGFGARSSSFLVQGYGDRGGPSRFFYCAKVSTSERERGCEALPKRSAGEVTHREPETPGLDSPRAGAGRTSGARNHHPTLKPISLTTYLATLLLPAPGRTRRILVPYAGAGSEMIGAYLAGWEQVDGIEIDAGYAEIAEARITRWRAE